MYSKALIQFLLTGLAPQTHMHTPKETDPKWSLLRPPARMERRTEDQNLPRTCPPRVIFELFEPGTSDGELTRHRRAAISLPSSGRSSRAPEHALVKMRCRSFATRPSRLSQTTTNSNHQLLSVPSVPFLYLSGAARFRRRSFTIGGGCRIP